MDGGLTCLTWNLWWRFDDWRARLRATTSILQDVQPDVCGLQEVWADADANASQLLAAELGLYWTWVPSPAPEAWQRRLGRPGVDIGNAVLSRWPITAVAHQRLPHGTATDDGRTVLYARVDAPGGPLPFFTTQLTSTPGAVGAAVRAGRRCRAVRPAAPWRPPTAGAHRRPQRRTGLGRDAPAGRPPDRTGRPRARPRRRLALRRATLPGLDVGPVQPPRTGERRAQRPDRLRARGSRPPGSGWTVQDARLVGDGPVDGVWPSDHAGVLTGLIMTPPPPREPAQRGPG